MMKGLKLSFSQNIAEHWLEEAGRALQRQRALSITPSRGACEMVSASCLHDSCIRALSGHSGYSHGWRVHVWSRPPVGKQGPRQFWARRPQWSGALGQTRDVRTDRRRWAILLFSTPCCLTYCAKPQNYIPNILHLLPFGLEKRVQPSENRNPICEPLWGVKAVFAQHSPANLISSISQPPFK